MMGDGTPFLEAFMLRSTLAGLIVAGSLLAQDPFVPLNLGSPSVPAVDRSVRDSWVRETNLRFQMSGKSMRVAIGGQDGLTAVVTAPGVEKPRHAKPILQGKGEHELLFKSLLGVGFTRIVVRNPDLDKEWSARIEKGKAVLEF